MLERLKWFVWSSWPQWMPAEIQREILAQSPYVCDQIAQGEPMIVMRRESWEAGAYEPVPGAPTNIDGEHWVIRTFLRDNPGWLEARARKG